MSLVTPPKVGKPEEEKQRTEQGLILHREFVGMLFALAIAEVAVRSAGIVNSSLDAWTKLPALSHLVLATTVIATSWVGWGRSTYSLSPVKHVFSKDFVELLIDVGLVGVYFFLVHGSEVIVSVQGEQTIQGSAAPEAVWIAVMFSMYVLWDLLTKWGEWRAVGQRIWGSILCAGLAMWTCYALEGLRGTTPVVLADTSLLALVLMFRAMKLNNLSDHNRWSWPLIIGLGLAWGVLTHYASPTLFP